MTSSDEMDSSWVSSDKKQKKTKKMNPPDATKNATLDHKSKKVTSNASSLNNNLSLDDIVFSKKTVPLEDPIEELSCEETLVVENKKRNKTLTGRSPQSSAVSPEDLMDPMAYPKSSTRSHHVVNGNHADHNPHRNTSAAHHNPIKKKKKSSKASNHNQKTKVIPNYPVENPQINPHRYHHPFPVPNEGGGAEYSVSPTYPGFGQGYVSRGSRLYLGNMAPENPVGAVNIPSRTAGGVFSARNELIALTSSPTISPKKPEVYSTTPPYPGQNEFMLNSPHSPNPAMQHPSDHSEVSPYRFDHVTIDYLPPKSPSASFYDQSMSLDISNHSYDGLPPKSPAYDSSLGLDISNHSTNSHYSTHSNRGRNTPRRSRRPSGYEASHSRNQTPQRARLRSYDMSHPEDNLKHPFQNRTRSMSGNGSLPSDHTPLMGSHQSYASYYSQDGSMRSSQPGAAERKKRHKLKTHLRQKSVELYMDDVKGVEQPPSFNDVLFAVLFLVNLSVVIYLAFTYGPKAIGDIHDTTSSEIEFAYMKVLYVSSLCGAFAVCFSLVLLLSMIVFAKKFIQTALIVSIGLSFSWGTIGIGLRPTSFVPATGVIALALTIGYAFVVWDRIPFAAANLCTALKGLTSNLSLIAIAFFYQVLLFVLSMFYLFAAIGVYDDLLEKGKATLGKWEGLVCISLLISYYWTYQVATVRFSIADRLSFYLLSSYHSLSLFFILFLQLVLYLQNLVEAVVAGTVRTWWFESSTSFHGCANVPMKSFKRASIYSFGSICKGCLTIGFVQLMRQFAIIFCPTRSNSHYSCLGECLKILQTCTSSSVEHLSRKLNPWAFTYVGMYGYNLTDSGEKATELFEKRGWHEIITDELLPNVLFMVCLVIGGITGCFGLLLESLDKFHYTSFEKPTLTAFL